MGTGSTLRSQHNLTPLTLHNLTHASWEQRGVMGAAPITNTNTNINVNANSNTIKYKCKCKTGAHANTSTNTGTKSDTHQNPDLTPTRWDRISVVGAALHLVTNGAHCSYAVIVNLGRFKLTDFLYSGQCTPKVNKERYLCLVIFQLSNKKMQKHPKGITT